MSNFPLIPIDTPFDELELSVRLYNGITAYLHGNYEKTAGDLLSINLREFSCQRSIGHKTIKELKRLLERIEQPASSELIPDPSVVSVLIAIRDENRAIEIELPRKALLDLGEFLSKIK